VFFFCICVLFLCELLWLELLEDDDELPELLDELSDSVSDVPDELSL
jgi:hypothetical protein